MKDWLQHFSFQKLIVPQCVECRGKDPDAQYRGSTKIKNKWLKKKSNKQTLKGNKQILKKTAIDRQRGRRDYLYTEG